MRNSWHTGHMSWGRFLSSCAATIAVGGCAVVAVGMGRAASKPVASPSTAATSASSSHRVAMPSPAGLAPSTSAAGPAESTQARASAPRPTARATTVPPLVARTAAASAPPAVVVPAARPVVRAAPPAVPRRARAAVAPRRAVAAPHGASLPLHYSTGSATRVITVVARSHGSTTAKLQAWTKASGGGWRKYGSTVTAHVGSQGLTSYSSESKSATPIGTFTLTQAFGRYRDPGTTLPYFTTRTSDWWISQAGRLYNTHQRCSSHCGFTRGSPNEHLYYETPYYNYAVVIDANTRNAPGGVRAGRGSAFFLHVTDGGPTAGCISISQSKLVSLMRWLRPSTHPRILIGVA